MGIPVGNKDMNKESCPHCGEEWEGYECHICGFADIDGNHYETPEGNIVKCSEEEAIERGYILTCPVCQDKLITWWEQEDHGMCIECWHKKHKNL